MWKCITRNLRIPFEKGPLPSITPTASADQNRGNVRVSKETKCQLPCPLQFVPCFLGVLQQHLSQFTIRYRSNEEHKEENHDKSSDKSNTGKSFHSQRYDCQPCTILEAVGLSGVLVLGWTILQPWYRHENRRERLNRPEINPDTVKRYCSLYKLLDLTFLQPVSKNVLPSDISSRLINDKRLQSSSTPPSSPTSSVSSTDSETKTIEEAFDEAAEEVKKVHQHAIGVAENRLGIACLSHSRNIEAIEHFKNALEFNHPPAAFNLGQCHELGIGTKQNFVQAAEFYRIASDLGHPTATYNLGVFYARGWGGLKADVTKARNLFMTAAALGQHDAQIALDMVNKTKSTIKKSRKAMPNSFESPLAFNLFNMSDIRLSFMNKGPISEQFSHGTSVYRQPESSLPSSPSPSSLSSSPPSSSSLSPINGHPLMFSENINAVEDSSESSGMSLDDELQMAIDLASMNGNSTTLYRLAVCYENNPKVDPELILQLYRMAADHGHKRAMQHLKVLEEQHALGTLHEYIEKNKRKTKYTSVSDCASHM